MLKYKKGFNKSLAEYNIQKMQFINRLEAHYGAGKVRAWLRVK